MAEIYWTREWKEYGEEMVQAVPMKCAEDINIKKFKPLKLDDLSAKSSVINSTMFDDNAVKYFLGENLDEKI